MDDGWSITTSCCNQWKVNTGKILYVPNFQFWHKQDAFDEENFGWSFSVWWLKVISTTAPTESSSLLSPFSFYVFDIFQTMALSIFQSCDGTWVPRSYIVDFIYKFWGIISCTSYEVRNLIECLRRSPVWNLHVLHQLWIPIRFTYLAVSFLACAVYFPFVWE